ncbi:pyrimidine/purine nucleoside phosphorylase [Geotalea sp. SG265]|uniref:pyrimidine/purine nucleoside phosphorylase n=1 Tax=Geotalea sp. SG265 TaxID=2922867 RepID=UPI001FB03E54|nr:pyrimidine/purine nucleoside phosphorylase [Geotalea sp. SG265]
MSEFNNVTVVKEANIFFNGGVTSRTIIFPSGEKKTLGIMMPGEYEFKTAAAELMEILSGDLDVQIGNAQSWQPVKGGESFEVPANSSFRMKVKTVADYCCSFLA